MIAAIFAGLSMFLLLAATPVPSPPLATESAQATKAGVTIDPRKLLVRPKESQADAPAPPSFMSDPAGWVQVKQRAFYEEMSRELRAIRGEHAASAALSLMLLSFAYGVLHAAGPGHGKAVVSAWLLANEREVRRGILIASLSAFFQALTAIVVVSMLLLTVSAAGSTARSIAGGLESTSYALIGILGLYMIWQALKPAVQPVPAIAASRADHAHQHAHHHHDHHHHEHDAHCGHAHMPSLDAVRGDFKLAKAVSLAFAVGLRPCTGAILALLFSSAIGLYWAGVAATFAMALGTAITVSVIAVLAVTSRGLALRFAGRDSIWLGRTVFGLRLLGGLVIALFGGLLFLGSLGGTAGFS